MFLTLFAFSLMEAVGGGGEEVMVEGYDKDKER